MIDLCFPNFHVVIISIQEVQFILNSRDHFKINQLINQLLLYLAHNFHFPQIIFFPETRNSHSYGGNMSKVLSFG